MSDESQLPCWPVGKRALQPPHISSDQPCLEVFKLLSELKGTPSLPVFKGEKFLGLAVHAELLKTFSNPLHYDLYRRRPIERLVKSNALSIDENCDVEEAIAAMSLARPEHSQCGIVVTRKGAYHGIVLTSALLEMTLTKTRWHITQVDQAHTAAQEASLAKSQFLATMSHEIRTPMNGIMGFTNLLMGTSLDETQTEYVTTIRDSNEALMAIINDILDLSKVESGALELESENFDLPATIENVMSLLRTRAQAKGLDLAFHCTNDVPRYIIGDCGRIRQILMNLIGNAIKFTETGAVAVVAKIDPDTDQIDKQAQIKISVIDTGIGIAEDKVDAIFERFTQEDNSTTRRFGGTGLGLSICRELVSAMDGTIGVVSQKGQGSEFWLSVPFGVDTQSGTTLDETSFAGKRALIVDDIEVNRRVIKLILESLGIEVTAVGDAGAAFSEVAKTNASGAPFDAIILDHMMPEMDGVQLAKALMSSSKHRLNLILSSSSDQVCEAEAMEWGFAACAPKPIRKSAIARALQRALDATTSDVVPTQKISSPATTMPDDRREDTGIRVLLVEDNYVNQKLVLAALKSTDISVDVVQDGAEAVIAVERLPYDVVVMDINMPQMNGMEATRRIRSRSGRGQKVPIIAMTANAMTGDRERFLSVGMDEYISKPVDHVKLHHMITKLASEGRPTKDQALAS